MERQTTQVILVLLTIFLTTTKSCGPCDRRSCNVDVSKCKDGVVKDDCGCCDVCGRKVGENCGGVFPKYGKCGKGLNCVKRRPNSVKIVGANDLFSGVCEREECKSKPCGYNQKCVINGRGKPRCVCPKYCKQRYAPVCGQTNGQHYWNRCHLRKDECRSQQRIGFVNGACKSCKDNGKTYKFGETITNREKCEKCVCRHGKWECEQDSWCQSEVFPELCDVDKNNCPEGFYCRKGQHEPSMAYIEIGFCIPLDDEQSTDDTDEQSGDDECPQLKCPSCHYGYIKDSQGCSTCECIKEETEKNICERPKNPGPCMANHRRFYYNSKKGGCFEFAYGGCLSNGNNFATKKKCERRCMKLRRKH